MSKNEIKCDTCEKEVSKHGIHKLNKAYFKKVFWATKKMKQTITSVKTYIYPEMEKLLKRNNPNFNRKSRICDDCLDNKYPRLKELLCSKSWFK